MKMTIELDGLTAATLEIARLARAITLTRERITRSTAEIAATKARLAAHLNRFREQVRNQKRRLIRQQRELKRQITRHNSNSSATRCDAREKSRLLVQANRAVSCRRLRSWGEAGN